jgi:hypothetical protein
MIDKAKVVYLADQLVEQVKIARDDGLTDLEIGAAIGMLLALVAPAKIDRLSILTFADRNAKNS